MTMLPIVLDRRSGRKNTVSPKFKDKKKNSEGKNGKRKCQNRRDGIKRTKISGAGGIGAGRPYRAEVRENGAERGGTVQCRRRRVRLEEG